MMKGSREEKYPASCYLQFSRTAAVTKTKKSGPINYVLIYDSNISENFFE